MCKELFEAFNVVQSTYNSCMLQHPTHHRLLYRVRNLTKKGRTNEGTSMCPWILIWLTLQWISLQCYIKQYMCVFAFGSRNSSVLEEYRDGLKEQKLCGMRNGQKNQRYRGEKSYQRRTGCWRYGKNYCWRIASVKFNSQCNKVSMINFAGLNGVAEVLLTMLQWKQSATGDWLTYTA